MEKQEVVVTAWDLILHLAPNDSGAHNNKGLALFKLGRYEESLACYEEAVELCAFAYQLDARERSVREAYAEIVQKPLIPQDEAEGAQL